MRHLVLYDNIIVETECIEMHFPNLKYLEYYPDYSKNDFLPPNRRPKSSDNEQLTQHFENVIRLNPDLRSFDIDDWSGKLLQKIFKYLSQLEKLAIDILDDEPDYGIDQVHFKNLKKIRFISCKGQSNLLSKIEFSFDQLEKFRVT